MNLSENSYIAIEYRNYRIKMIVIVIYTVILLFVDRTAVSTQCMNALEQWYQHMIPALFPMMLFSSVLVDTGVAHRIGTFLSKTILKPFQISKAGGYCLLTGFMFGFPMGAKTTADMHIKGNITKEEATYLLSFVNCIGPMYTISVVSNLFEAIPIPYLIAGIYGLPLFYGLILRYTLYRNKKFDLIDEINTHKIGMLDALYETVPKSSKSMVYLGGYMILFQISFVSLTHLLEIVNVKANIFYPLLEITGGLYLLPKETPIYSILFYTIWGGFSCFLQTYSFIKPAGLNMKSYFVHKCILSTLGYLFGLFLTSVL